MATPFLGLRTCIYRIPAQDLAAATAWYAKAFGIQPYFQEPFYVGFEVGGYELGLHPADEVAAGDNVETYWGVANVDAVFAQLLANGATSHQEPSDVGSDIWVATAKDPWGNIIGIIHNPHFSVK